MSLHNRLFRLIEKLKKEKLIPVIVPVEHDTLLHDKVAFISGGGGGIGMAIAKAFLECGCKIILGGTNQDKLSKCKNQLSPESESMVETYVFDISEPNKFKEDIEMIARIFGKIDIYVNSAGVHTDNLDFWNLTSEEFDRIVSINLRGSYFACIEMAKYMKENNIQGHMLIISSSRGFEPAWSPYGISKWALNGMIKGLAQQFIRFGITINGLAPGPTATELIGVGNGDSIYTNETKINRLVIPEEISALANLLVSDASNAISGEIIRVSVGRGIFDIR